MIRRFVTWWDAQPQPVRDFVEGGIAALAGALYTALRGIDWANPTLTPTLVGNVVVAALVAAALAYVRHAFRLPEPPVPPPPPPA